MKYILLIPFIPVILFVLIIVCVSIKMFKSNNSFILFLTNNQTFVSPIQEGNLPSDFYTVLPEKLMLENDYEVALIELSFRKDWTNIADDQVIRMSCDRYIDIGEPLIILSKNNFDNIEKLLEALNQVIENERETYKFTQLPQFSIDKT